MADLERFRRAQKRDFEIALSEIKSGRKRSHWMWYIFPQIAGLGMSSTAEYYAIRDIEEAREFLDDEMLGGNIVEISEALLLNESSDPLYVMGYPDNLKLRSSMTLFDAASDGKTDVFKKVIDKFYGGELDQLTLELI